MTVTIDKGPHPTDLHNAVSELPSRVQNVDLYYVFTETAPDAVNMYRTQQDSWRIMLLCLMTPKPMDYIEYIADKMPGMLSQELFKFSVCPRSTNQHNTDSTFNSDVTQWNSSSYHINTDPEMLIFGALTAVVTATTMVEKTFNLLRQWN
ncbi:hypothetical protein G7Y79_00016g040410 [Physcia stellaris]|nr:hypothetical protein G7Y79_00016g040410 [Physcia stellaris]